MNASHYRTNIINGLQQKITKALLNGTELERENLKKWLSKP